MGLAVPAHSREQTLRIATWNGDFSRKGPGLLLRDLTKPDPVPGLATIDTAGADILHLTDIDYDAGHAALGALQARLADPYPYIFALRPNTGMATGRDIDGDGRLGGPRDAQGYGWFSGQGGQAILSRYPLTLRADLTELLWKDIQNSAMAENDPAHDLQRLSHSAHWAVDVHLSDNVMTLLTVAATPPVFDGPEDRNGRRNADEVRLWPLWIAGSLGGPPEAPVLLLGKLNLDPDRGQGLHETVGAVLRNPALADHHPGTDTVLFERAGPMRISYVLPDASLSVVEAGILPPEPGAGPHRLVWVDIILP